MTVKATKKHTYGGKEYDVGQEYEFEIADLDPAHVLTPANTVLVEKNPQTQTQEYKTREVKAAK